MLINFKCLKKIIIQDRNTILLKFSANISQPSLFLFAAYSTGNKVCTVLQRRIEISFFFIFEFVETDLLALVESILVAFSFLLKAIFPSFKLFELKFKEIIFFISRKKCFYF